MTDDPDELDELGRVLRDRVGSEFRAEAEEGERLAELAALRGRTVADVAADLASSGERVTITTATRQLTGTVTATGRDFLELASGAGTVVVNLGAPIGLRPLGPDPDAAPMQRPGVSTLRGRLLELELDGTPVEVWSTDGRTWQGTPRAVARDHLLLRDAEGEVVVPSSAIGLVIVR